MRDPMPSKYDKLKFDELKPFLDRMRFEIDSIDVSEDDIYFAKQSIRNILDRVQDISASGYLFGKQLRLRTKELYDRTKKVENRFDLSSSDSIEDLTEELDTLIDHYEKLNVKYQKRQLSAGDESQFYARLERLQAKLHRAGSRFSKPVEAINDSELDISLFVSRLENMVTILDEASFALSDEQFIYIAAAILYESRAPKIKIPGFIYLTTNRLVFEQRDIQDKRFGLFGGRLVKQVRLNVSIDNIVDISVVVGKDKTRLRVKDATNDGLLEMDYGWSPDLWRRQVQDTQQKDFDSVFDRIISEID